ncbi:acyl-CoA dehydrogenase C-terminal domain-containing protein [Streptomyces bobili]
MAWIWLDLAITAHPGNTAFHHGKTAAARYFFTHELPTVDHKLDLLATRDTQLLDLDPTCL